LANGATFEQAAEQCVVGSTGDVSTVKRWQRRFELRGDELVARQPAKALSVEGSSADAE